MKKLLLVSLCFFCALCASAQSAKANLNSIVQTWNASCPFNLGNFCTVNSIKYDKKQNEAKWMFTINAGMINENALSEISNSMKESMKKSLASTENIGLFMKPIADAGASFSVKMAIGNTGKELNIKFSNEEVKSLANGDIKPSDDREMLQMIVQNADIQCPMKVDEVTTMTSVRFEGNDIVYSFEFDESKMDISMLESNKDVYKQNISESLKRGGTIIETILGYCRKANCGFSYKYVGSKSGQVFTIHFNSDEL